MRAFVYRHTEEPERTVIVQAGASTIMLWLWGFDMKPVYALRIKWKQGMKPHG